jgi:hypothetical protein
MEGELYRISKVAFLIEKLAVRTHTNQLQNVCVRFAINQQKIRFEVTFPMIAPFASQCMVATLFKQRSILGEQRSRTYY